MLVDVTLMRERGEKLSKDALHVARAYRGFLRIGTYVDKAAAYEPDRPAVRVAAASLAEGPQEWAKKMLGLDKVCITRLRGASMVLVGEESVGNVHRPERYPQAWLVRVVSVDPVVVEAASED